MDTPHSRPHGRDLRRGRRSEPGGIYLLTAVTHRRAAVFADFRCGRAVVQALRAQHERGRVRSLAFVVMPDHLHWLVELRQPLRLALLVGQVKGYSAYAVNRLRPGTGRRLWQRGFHDHALRREEGLRAAARYVVANPLRAGLVARIGDYPLWDAAWL
jgi:REP element-mobilizing transposase RayT